MQLFRGTLSSCIALILVQHVVAPSGDRQLKFSAGYDFPTSNEIIRTETTYTPGRMEKNMTGLLLLWPGVWEPAHRTDGQLIQTVFEGSKTGGTSCGGRPGQWCMAPFVMHGVTWAEHGRRIPVDHDARIRIIYTKSGDEWRQETIDLKTGKMMHNYTRGSGKKVQFEFSTEMQYGNNGPVSTQIYTDTVITLSGPDPSFGSQARRKGDAIISGLTSEKGGQVWKIAKSEIPPMRHGETW